MKRYYSSFSIPVLAASGLLLGMSYNPKTFGLADDEKTQHLLEIMGFVTLAVGLTLLIIGIYHDCCKKNRRGSEVDREDSSLNSQGMRLLESPSNSKKGSDQDYSEGSEFGSQYRHKSRGSDSDSRISTYSDSAHDESSSSTGFPFNLKKIFRN